MIPAHIPDIVTYLAIGIMNCKEGY